MLCSQEPFTWVGDPEMGDMLHFRMLYPRSKRSKPHTGLPSVVGSAQHQEHKPTKHLALKVSGVFFWKRQRAIGNGDSIFFLLK